MRAWLQAQFHASGQLSGLVYGIQYPSSVTFYHARKHLSLSLKHLWQYHVMMILMILRVSELQFGMPGSLKYVCTELRLVLHDAVWVPHALGNQRLRPLLARDLEG